ncbi:MAG: hypothetical protein ABFD25_00005 [Clostridiaceae bacterium]
MRNFKKVLSVLTTLIMLLCVPMGCGSAKTPAESSSAVSSAATAQATAAAFDPMAKYESPVTITVARRTQQGAKFSDGQSMEGDNIWNKLYSEYGINIKTLWSADASQYTQKLNLSIASEEIPDLLYVYDSQKNMMEKANMTMDMKPYYDKYATENTKKVYESDGGIGLKAATSGEKLLFLPTNQSDQNSQGDLLWIRADWLKNVGMSEPKTIDDMEKIMDAFVHNDPNKDGKGGTYALGIAGKDNLVNDWASTCGVFQGFHVMPVLSVNNTMFFNKDSSGNITWDGTNPNTKLALQRLQDWYKKGYLSADLSTTDAGGKLVQDLTASKFGMVYCPGWLPSWPLPDLKKKIASADWIPVSPPTIDGKAAQIFGYTTVGAWYAVSKDCKNPEAIMKMMNLYVDKAQTDPANYSTDYVSTDAGRGSYCCAAYVWDTAAGRTNYEIVSAAVKAKDSSLLKTPQQTARYDSIMKYLNDPTDITGWSMYWFRIKAHKVLYEDMTVKNNAYIGALTDLMASKIPTLKKMEQEVISKIIYDKASVSDWDKMVEDWGKLGGDEILKEVAELTK